MQQFDMVWLSTCENEINYRYIALPLYTAVYSTTEKMPVHFSIGIQQVKICKDYPYYIHRI